MAIKMTKFYLGRRPDATRWIPSFIPINTDPRRLVSVASWDFDTCQSHLEFFSLSPAKNIENENEDEFEDENENEGMDRSPFEFIGEWSPQGKITEFQILPSDYDHSSTFICSSSLGHFSVFKNRFDYQTDAITTSFDSNQSSILNDVHDGKITAFDVFKPSQTCISVGEDRKFCSIDIETLRVKAKVEYDSFTSFPYSAIQFISADEFVTCGFNGFHWWDLRQSKRPHSQTSIPWNSQSPGTFHSLAVHPFQKHLLIAGGSKGRVLCLDRRHIFSIQKKNAVPIIELSGDYANANAEAHYANANANAEGHYASPSAQTLSTPHNKTSPLPPGLSAANQKSLVHTKTDLHADGLFQPAVRNSYGNSGGNVRDFDSEIAVLGFRNGAESMADGEVWQVQFDLHSNLSVGNANVHVPPLCFCSQDGILAYLSNDKKFHIVDELSSIHTFDISAENRGEIISGLENETLLHIQYDPIIAK